MFWQSGGSGLLQGLATTTADPPLRFLHGAGRQEPGVVDGSWLLFRVCKQSDQFMGMSVWLELEKGKKAADRAERERVWV